MANLKIVADENIPLCKELFSEFGELTTLAGRTMTADDVADADVLLVRSVTKVNADLLSKSQVKFVGTATIGIDHLDIDYLDKQNIRWVSAPGSNAISVAEYVLSVLAHFCDRRFSKLAGLKAGVIGYGNVGKQVASRLKILGLDVVVYDPLISPTSTDNLVELDDIIRCDVVCVHAPITYKGPFPSFHMLIGDTLRKLPQGAFLISAGRGGVIANHAIDELSRCRPDIKLAFDVWENEPNIDWSAVSHVDLATPHIAGYSKDGKIAGALMLKQSLMDFLAIDQSTTSAFSDEKCSIDLSGIEPQWQLAEAILTVYDVASDDLQMKALLKIKDLLRGSSFDHLRKSYPERREFSNYILLNADKSIQDQAKALGFGLESRYVS